MTAPTVGAFSGLSHAELVAAYQECRARNAKLEEALSMAAERLHALANTCESRECYASAEAGRRAARAILAEVTP